MYFCPFQSVAYNLYEIPLFIMMGAIGKNSFMCLEICLSLRQGVPDSFITGWRP